MKDTCKIIFALLYNVNVTNLLCIALRDCK